MIEKINENWTVGELEYPFGRGVNFSIEVENIDLILESLQKNNYPIKIMPKENWYRRENTLLGSREFLVIDPDGYLLRFTQDMGVKPVE